MKRSRRSSFLIRDLLSPGGSGHLSPAGSRGLAFAHLRGTPQLNLALSRPSLTRLFTHHPPYFPVGYTCPSCPAWTSGPCLGLIHGKCFFSNKVGLLSGDVNRHTVQNVSEPAFPLPIPLPVYVRSRASESPPPGSGKMRKSRRSRTVFTELQLMGLERRFDKQKYLSTPDRIELADTLGLSQIQVKTWYQNRRMKWKKQVLSAGGTEAPTKPKGRPKKNSIPSAEELQAIQRQASIEREDMSGNNTGAATNSTVTGQLFDT